MSAAIAYMPIEPMRIESLDPPASALHADWRGLWGGGLPTELRDNMFADPRLDHRMGALCARAAGAPPVNAATLRTQDKSDYLSYMSDPRRAAWLAGLIWHASALSGIVLGADMRALAQSVPAEDIAAALSHRSLAPKSREASIEPSRLAEAVLISGQRCVRSWAGGLPDALRVRAMLTLPSVLGAAAPPNFELDRHSSPIINAVLQELADQKQGAH